MASLRTFSIVTVGLTFLLCHGVTSDTTAKDCTHSEPPSSINTTYTDGSDKVVTEFPCSFYYYGNNNGCEKFPGAGFQLPDGIGNGSSVSKPRDFAATLFLKDINYGGNFGVQSCSGAAFTWTVPADGSSRDGTDGYFLRMSRVGSATTNCRVFDIRALPLSNPKIRFRFETYPFPIPDYFTYIVDLFSLPAPSPEEMEAGSEVFESIVVGIPPCRPKSESVTSAKWSTWILVKDHKNGSVEVSFGLPDNSLNFTFQEYHVRLFENATVNPINKTKISAAGTQGSYTFHNVPTGVYFVQVFPDDPYFQDENHCLCNDGKNTAPLPGLKCGSCTRSQTSEFSVKGKPPVTATTTTTTATTTTTTTSSPLKTGEVIGNDTGRTDPSVVVGAVVGTLALTTVVVVVAFLCRRQVCDWKRKHFDFNKNNINGKPEKRAWTTGIILPSLTGIVEKELPQLKCKRIFLLAAEDHPYHIKAVEMYADFLRVHCHCDVTFASQCRQDLRGKIVYCWMSGEIEQADYVIIVTSAAACRLYQAFQKGLIFREADFGPEGDLFTPGIQHICGMITCNADMQKVLMVHFDHTPSTCRLPIGALPSSLYLLPKHLGEFLKHIHGVDHGSSALSKVLPLQCNIALLPEGKAWLSAIQEAKAYERNFPDWFEEKFGKASEVMRSPKIPEFTTQESGFYSNEGGSIGSRNSADMQRKLSSVSMEAERLVSGMDYMDARTPLPVFTITKDDFFEPSICYSAYTVPPGSTFAGGNMPEEIDDRGSTTSERLRRFNQQYELDRLEEGTEQSGATKEESAPMYTGLARRTVRDEHVYVALPQVQGSAFENAEEVDEDCISISSAQSV